ncbi:small GTP-binding protein, putative [Trichomonas vaginalis G3]|uniref:Small GTP-binding protein, putative n=1 Tax=Trichomonas vaginalis (strain ATCC PRA-98 / G3) TaxID=412133 RepID=A2EU59_TRIV3|nr:GTPase protein [Trichomonas vaginalis G3]EAY03807.1 small GTP-binding protein, putative [Trichomonas vaginalis G3]KAI5552671.1 GTPase protein [Trichomonas vaginalis G3]|eukprot:XP_001316030.1 small GTP-binding protein [Trichomonas vaginalis G3]
MQRESAFKVVLIGDAGTGKTSMLNRLISQQFSETVQPTVGAGYYTWVTRNGEHTIKLNIWDTAGQEMYKSVGSIYYRSSQACLLIVPHSEADLDYKSLDEWCARFREVVGEKVPIIIAATKYDLKTEESEIKIQEYAKLRNLTVFNTSAKTGQGVLELFEYLALEIYRLRDTSVFRNVCKCRHCEKCENCCK